MGKTNLPRCVALELGDPAEYDTANTSRAKTTGRGASAVNCQLVLDQPQNGIGARLVCKF